MRTIPREVYFLNKAQTAVLIGTLLGDGGLRYHGKNCRLHVKHSASQLPLVQFKRQIFNDLTTMPIREFSQMVRSKEYYFVEFVTRTDPSLTYFYNVFYRDGKKIIPKNIQQLLTDRLSLAVWFMDDGSAEYAGASFQTHCFGLEEVQLLQQCLKFNFELVTTIRQNKSKWILYIPKSSLIRFRELTKKDILDHFLYKLTPYSKKKINPVETERQGPAKRGYDTVRSVQ